MILAVTKDSYGKETTSEQYFEHVNVMLGVVCCFQQCLNSRNWTDAHDAWITACTEQYTTLDCISHD